MNEAETMLEMLGGRERVPRTIAVVGLSDDPGKASHGVSAYMQAHGYKILPVNPGIESALGETYSSGTKTGELRPDLRETLRHLIVNESGRWMPGDRDPAGYCDDGRERDE